MNTRRDYFLKKELEKILLSSKEVRPLALLIFLVGVHSLGLGIFIFFLTDFFYHFFFHAKVENLFFVRQSGLFLFCIGLFNLCPLLDLKKKHRLVIVIIGIKILAVLFLVTHASLTAWPPIIYLAAVLDGLMALLLALFYRNARRILYSVDMQ